MHADRRIVAHAMHFFSSPKVRVPVHEIHYTVLLSERRGLHNAVISRVCGGEGVRERHEQSLRQNAIISQRRRDAPCRADLT